MEHYVHGGDVYRNSVKWDFSVNINPQGIPHFVRQAMAEAAKQCERYPDYEARELILEIAESEGIPETDILCGNGASELFLAIVHAVAPKKTLIPVPSFYGYERAAQAGGGELVFFPLKEAEGFMVTEVLLDALTPDIRLLFLANPNNPTGKGIPDALLERILERCREQGIVVVLDECFLEFTENGREKSKISEILRNPNLIVVRAFTKLYAIPGVRLGYLCCSDKTLREKISLQLAEWNLSVFAQKAGIAAIRETEYRKRTPELVKNEREYLLRGLCGMEPYGLTVFSGEANFILVRSSLPLYDLFLQRGILIRDCSDFRGMPEGYYRIAVRGHEENQVFLEAMREIVCREAQKSPENLKITEKPEEIEQKSFGIIGEELRARGILLPKEQEAVTKRVIHTSADFDYAKTLTYSENAVEIASRLLRGGAALVTDTQMALAGINKKRLARYGGSAYCFMADEEVAAEAKARGITRAAVSMEKAAKLEGPVVFVIGNAPTALLKLHEMIRSRQYLPAFIIGVPVGFVNVEISKELILQTEVPCIVNRGRKGGSNIAAAICNAILYQLE